MDDEDGSETEEDSGTIAVSTGPMANKSHVRAKETIAMGRVVAFEGSEVTQGVHTSFGLSLGRANCMRIIGLDYDEGDENGTPGNRFRTVRWR